MKSVITIILLICSILMMFGSVFLFSAISDVTAGPTEVVVDEPEQESPSPDGSAEIIVIEDEEGHTDAEIEDYSAYPVADDFLFTDQNGTTVRLSDFYGKPIIINFFATWCPPCQAELPYFNKAYLNYGDRIHFLVIDLVDEDGEDVENGLSFISSNGYSFPLYFDSEGQGYNAYGTGYIPMTILISPDGHVLDSHVGGLGEDEVQALVDRLLN